MQEGDTNPTVLNEPYPCEGCPHYNACATEQMSCHAFHVYANYDGKMLLDERHPSVTWYHVTFVKQRRLPRRKDDASLPETCDL